MDTTKAPGNGAYSEEPKKKKKDFLTVGIGASAGGVQALKEFFSKMTPDAGMAYVVVLHLSRSHESNLAEILQRETTMPVVQVNETTRVEPDHVYVIPPAKGLEMVDGVVRVTDPGRPRAPHVIIDRFFRTLAAAYGDSAVGVVMSGTGADGTIGIKKIKEENGFAIVQKPEEAEFDQMPLSAIQTGLVDWILPVAEMPDKLLALRHSTEKLNLIDEDDGNFVRELKGAEALRDILAILRVRTGHDFTNYKPATLLRRIARQLQIHELLDLTAYVNLLRESPEEAQSLLKYLLINVTNFFRDREAFEVLESDVIPRLFAGKSAQDQIRVWSGGCSTGEEAYSLAILFCEYAEKFEDSPKIQIFASDVDDDAISQAREGLYSEGITNDVSPARLKRFFVKEGKGYRVKKALREMILFAPHNVLRDPPFSKLDLITFRNVMIYLNRETQERLLQLFHFALVADGFLFLGSSESADSVPLLFSPYDKKQRIYLRRPTSPALIPAPLSLPVNDRWQARGGRQIGGARTGDRSFSFEELHYRLIEKFAPPSVVVNEDYEIVHLSENAGRFLHFVGGEPTNNLLKVVNPDLCADLRAALFSAKQDRRQAKVESVRTRIDGVTRFVAMTVLNVAAPDGAGNFLLVIFDETAAPQTIDLTSGRSEAAGGATGSVGVSGGDDAAGGTMDILARHLEEELKRTKDRLRVTVEQYDTSIEELKAANEELQAINEELRSATEELESSKEELQSVNEEMSTVNHELKEKIDELSATNADLQNLMQSTDIATVFLDRNLQIKRFTRTAQEIFNIINTDTGRPIQHLTHRLDYPQLVADAKEVLRTLRPVEREIRGGESFYLTRVHPYRAADDRIDGIVLTFLDITERRRAESALRESDERLRLIMDNAADYAIMTLDPEGRYTDWNTGAERIFGFTKEEAVGLSTAIIFTPEDREKGEHLKELETARREGRAADERFHVDKHGSRFYVSGVMMALGEGGGGKQLGFAKIARDLTERQQMEEALREADRRKDEFLATLAHELRNPLAPIRSGVEIIRRGGQDEETMKKVLDIMQRQTNQIVHLVDDLLEISRITQGKIKLRRIRMSLKAAIDTARDGTRETIEKAGHEFTCKLPDEPVYIDGDPTRVTQVIQNLLINSGKYTPPGGKIRLTVRTEEGEAVLSIRDTGIGIPAGMLSKIFDMFSQIENPAQQARGGLGIGLSVVKKLVEMHGGTVSALSEGEGKGSEFIIRLPLAVDENGNKAKARSEKENGEPRNFRDKDGKAPPPAELFTETEKAQISFLKTVDPAERDGDGYGGNTVKMKKRRILVVDDNTDAAKMLDVLLSNGGHKVSVAYDGESGIEKAREFQPEVCLLDIGLPKMDGYEAARQLREFLPDALLISVSGWGQEKDRQRSKEAGFDFHLVKPVEIEDVKTLLRQK